MQSIKVGDKVKVTGADYHNLGHGSICTVLEIDSDNDYLCRDPRGHKQYIWLRHLELVGKCLSDERTIELAHEMNKVWNLRNRNSDLLDEMVDMVEQLGLLKGDMIDDRLVTNFADRYLGGF